VNVVDFVTLNVRPDTTICLNDSVQLYANSNGLRYVWSPAAGISDPTIINPTALPAAPTTTYTLSAYIGPNCPPATDAVIIRTVPYPVVNAGNDTVICFNTSAQLQGSMDGTEFTWTPAGSLLNANTLTPIATPADSTMYILTARNLVSGCPKPVSDSVYVHVLPKIMAFAGRDTMVVIGQPLQFNASGGTRYEWVPPSYLNNPFIPNPIGVYSGDIDSIRYKTLVYNDADCVDSAFVTVKIFRTIPSIFVPDAFTPNGDGLNDVIRPIAVGMKNIEYFRIYNRWGQLVFSTTQNGRGWDGRIRGVNQGTNVYVWIVKAMDYTGREYISKGTVTLIR
jgi:gliding motility-associated-like protein